MTRDKSFFIPGNISLWCRIACILSVLLFTFGCIHRPSGDKLGHSLYGEKAVHIGLNTLQYDDGQLIYLYVPGSVMEQPEKSSVFAVIHGYFGRETGKEGFESVYRSFDRWRSFAQEHRLVIVAPHFDKERFDDDYQRLNLKGKRADFRLNDIIAELPIIIPGIDTQKIYLFGFSGGGQFVHRYAAFHPNRVAAAVAGGAGWYLWPSEEYPYPLGLKMKKKLQPDIEKIGKVPLLILVGDDDVHDEFLRHYYHHYNLNKIQGETRKERAMNWERAISARLSGKKLNICFLVVPHTGHAITTELFKAAKYFLENHSIPDHFDAPENP